MIEYKLRKDLVNLTSPIVYTSTKMNINTAVLFDYLKFLHFKIPFKHSSNINKDTLFIPMGLDNPDVLDATFSTSGIEEKAFDSIIVKQEEQTEGEKQEIKVKAHQEFLEEVKKMSKAVDSTPAQSDVRKPSTTTSGKMLQRGGSKMKIFDKNQTKNLLKLLEEDD